MVAEIAEDLVRSALADYPKERIITLLAISVAHLDKQPMIQLELPLGLPDEQHRPGTRRSAARWSADRAMDAVRERFGRDAVGYATAQLDHKRSVPDAFRELAILALRPFSTASPLASDSIPSWSYGNDSWPNLLSELRNQSGAKAWRTRNIWSSNDRMFGGSPWMAREPDPMTRRKAPWMKPSLPPMSTPEEVTPPKWPWMSLTTASPQSIAQARRPDAQRVKPRYS
jgi:hypothetical protein